MILAWKCRDLITWPGRGQNIWQISAWCTMKYFWPIFTIFWPEFIESYIQTNFTWKQSYAHALTYLSRQGRDWRNEIREKLWWITFMSLLYRSMSYGGKYIETWTSTGERLFYVPFPLWFTELNFSAVHLLLVTFTMPRKKLKIPKKSLKFSIGSFWKFFAQQWRHLAAIDLILTQ